MTLLSLLFLLFVLESVTSWTNVASYHRRHSLGSVLFDSVSSTSITPKQIRTEALEKNHGGILYRTSVFNKEEFAFIAQDVQDVIRGNALSQESPLSVAKHRLGAILSPDCRTVEIFRKGSLHKLVQQLTSNDYELSEHVPIEIRSYEKPGACMAWHSDDVLYRDPPQVEVVWTLENSSDCQTMWKSIKQGQGEVVHQSVETEKNSVILLRGGGVEHCVTSLKRGKRIIIKCVYASKHATFVSQTKDAAQFEAIAKKKKKR